ncbi:MAG: KpsF/GutQ family sugar-phosphate isomerase [Roseococcus sp.]
MDYPIPPASPLTSSLETARRVVRLEAGALESLAEGLDASFDEAVRILGQASGRVVVSGMGKSGHIGRKIAASFASTGTPAQFVHPGEASHGDLGMIRPGDAVLAISNSGETAELADLVVHARRFGIPLVAIVGRAGSTLARDSDVALLLPPVEEACPHGLAPTTSTTMQLALGDALAVALLTRRGFGPEDFRVFHPGGKLGARLLRVTDLMHGAAELPLAPEDMPMAEALLAMTAKRFGCLGVTDGAGCLIGIITDGDLRRALQPGGALLSRRTGEVMTRQPRSIGPETLAAEALRLMNASSITTLFVVDGEGRPQGILHIHDLLRAGIA